MSSAVSVGMRFGKWTVVGEAEKRPVASYPHLFKRYWPCQCECGTERSVAEYSLKRGGSMSCGCGIKHASGPRGPQTTVTIDGVVHRSCPRCDRTLPLTHEFWNRSKNSATGFDGYCRDCVRASHATDEFNACRRQKRADNLEAFRAADRKQYSPKRRAGKYKWRDQNKEKVAASDRQKKAKRRAAKNATDASLLAITDDILQLLANRTYCPLCRHRMSDDPLHLHAKQVDHIVPIIVGGTHVLSNLRVICKDCNLRRPKDGSDVQGQIALWAVA